MKLKNAHRMNCCLSTVKMVTQTRQNVTLYGHSLCCYFVPHRVERAYRTNRQNCTDPLRATALKHILRLQVNKNV
jgi:hypothetical protein